jgi:acyl carrier protein
MTTTPQTHDDVTAGVLNVLERILLATPEELAAQPRLGAYKWDSLTTLEAMVSLESIFAIRIDLRDLHSVSTVDDLVDLVRRSKRS